MTKPHLAKVIELRRRGSRAEVMIDGEPFPWHVARVAEVSVDCDGVPSVTVTILADRVRVENDLTHSEPS